MYCNNCGSQIAEGAAFCSHCGSAVSSNVQDNMKSQNGNMMYQNSGIQGTKKKANIVAIISAALLAIAMFLPYVSIDDSFVSVSKALIDGDGVLFLIVAAIGMIGALVKKNGIVIFSGVLACLLSIVEIVVFARNEYREFFTRGAGFYMMIIASASLLISGFIKRK